MATDAEIRAAGLYAVPKNKYLQNEFQLPTEEVVEEETESFGIPNTNAFNNSGGNDFSVYNPDPNSISNRDYNPRPYYNAIGKEFYEPEQSKFKEMMSKGINFIPGIGMAKQGLEFLKNQIGPYMPTNRRAIMENQLGGQGIMVNDIGQIVQGDGAYDDISGRNVMAGYNASKIDEDTYKKRRDMINETINRKLKADPTYDRSYLDNRLTALDASEKSVLGTATDRADKIFDFEEEEKKKKKKDTVVGRYLDKRDRVSLAEQQTNPEGPSNASSGTAGGSPDNFNGGTTYDNSRGDFRNADGSNVNQDFSTTASVSNYDPSVLYADGGRAGYFFGGRARLQGGGMSQGNESNISQSTNMGGGITGDLSTAQQTAREATYDGNKNTGTAQGYSQHYAKGGRAGYFFGGRVSFKNGGLASIL